MGDIMTTNGTKLKLITGYTVSLTIFFVISIYLYNLLITTNKYYLFIVIPILFLSLSTGLLNLFKLILTIITFIFDRNDNDEVIKFINKVIRGLNQFYKYILIGIFISLLTTVMILDVILCISFQQYILLAISIVIWIMLYYMIFYIIIYIIKRRIDL